MIIGRERGREGGTTWRQYGELSILKLYFENKKCCELTEKIHIKENNLYIEIRIFTFITYIFRVRKRIFS